ncbi:MAG TPA: UvrB/UvrC motif-containing protein [Gemmatimonadales bacterium]|jgi:protein arginine kinase activator|nr:UvrB/UvrC motif-containing protein [Gemmatimonadales bacterium]
MIPCQTCHTEEAVVHLTQVVGDQVTTLHLCSKCAAERGIATEMAVAQTPLGAFLAAMGKGGAPLAAAAAGGDACPACGATLQDFRASGRVGCPECWAAFERPLRDLLRRVHGATRHTGQSYESPEGASRSADGPGLLRAQLRDQLRAAVEAEQFELAAELRDRLRGVDEP